MLGNTMKYELRARARLLLPFFGLAVVLTGLLRLVLQIAPYIWQPIGNIMEQLASGVGALVVTAVTILAVVYMIVRFWQAFTTGEAYLTFTLPVKTSTHLWAHTILSLLYILAACVVAFVCGIILVPGLWAEIWTAFTAPLYSISLVLELIGIAATVAATGGIALLLQVFASVAIGAQLSRHRIVGSIGGFIGLSVLQNIITGSVLRIVAQSWEAANVELVTQSQQTAMITVVDEAALFTFAPQVIQALWEIVLPLAGTFLLMAAAYFGLVWWLFDKKLNLE